MSDQTRDRIAERLRNRVAKSRARQAAKQPEQPREDERDEQRSFQRVADRQPLAGDPAADQPLSAGELVHGQRGLVRRGLAGIVGAVREQHHHLLAGLHDAQARSKQGFRKHVHCRVIGRCGHFLRVATSACDAG